VRNSLLTVVRNAPSASAMRIVAFRLLVDGLAGIRYLIQGQPKHTLAIVQAHFDFYRRFSLYALNPGKKPKSWPQVGVYSGSILWNQLLRRPSAME
jgi:hypothetical protein